MLKVINIGSDTECSQYSTPQHKSAVKKYRVIGTRIGFITNKLIISREVDPEFKKILQLMWNKRLEILAMSNINDVPKSIVKYLSWDTYVIDNRDLEGICELLQLFEGIFTFDVTINRTVVDTAEDNITVKPNKYNRLTVKTTYSTTKVNINYIITIIRHIIKLNIDEGCIKRTSNCSLYKYDDYKHLYTPEFSMLPFSISQGKTKKTSYQRNVSDCEYNRGKDITAIIKHNYMRRAKYNTVNLNSAIPSHARIINRRINTYAEAQLHNTTKAYLNKYKDMLNINFYAFNDESNPYINRWRETCTLSRESWQLSSRLGFIISNLAWTETALTVYTNYHNMYELPSDVKAYIRYTSTKLANMNELYALFKNIMLKQVSNDITLYDCNECMYVDISGKNYYVHITKNVNCVEECINFDNRVYDFSISIPVLKNNSNALSLFTCNINAHINELIDTIHDKAAFSTQLFVYIMHMCYKHLVDHIKTCLDNGYTIHQTYPDTTSNTTSNTIIKEDDISNYNDDYSSDSDSDEDEEDEEDEGESILSTFTFKL